MSKRDRTGWALPHLPSAAIGTPVRDDIDTRSLGYVADRTEDTAHLISTLCFTR